MAKKPTVTVVIPTFNRGHCVDWAISSATVQQNLGVEVIVVDDASNDNTVDVVSGLMEYMPTLRLVRHENNRGVSAARNTGIAAAKGDYIAFLDSDDLWETPLKLCKQVGLLSRARGNKEDYACVTYYEGEKDIIREETGRMAEVKLPEIFGAYGYDGVPVLKTYSPTQIRNGIVSWHLWFGIGSTLCAHRAVFDKHGGFNETLGMGEDTEFLTRFVLNGGTAKVVPEIMMTYALPEAGKQYANYERTPRFMIQTYAARVYERLGPKMAKEFVETHLRRLFSDQCRAGRFCSTDVLRQIMGGSLPQSLESCAIVLRRDVFIDPRDIDQTAALLAKDYVKRLASTTPYTPRRRGQTGIRAQEPNL